MKITISENDVRNMVKEALKEASMTYRGTMGRCQATSLTGRTNPRKDFEDTVKEQIEYRKRWGKEVSVKWDGPNKVIIEWLQDGWEWCHEEFWYDPEDNSTYRRIPEY